MGISLRRLLQFSAAKQLWRNVNAVFPGLLLICLAPVISAAEPPDAEPATVLVVVGAAGEDEFGKAFSESAARWEKAAGQAGAKVVTIGLAPPGHVPDRERLQQALAAAEKESGDLWLVLLGHGTFDGKEAKFNLRGPDFSATELAGWLKPLHRPVAVIDTASCSSPFIKAISGEGRIIITATRSGHEQNYTRLGQYLSESITDPQADLDKDGQVSLLEAFLTASRKVGEFYQLEGRLATEHALVDDNGDGLGTPADWFRGIRAVKKAKDGAALDGFRAQQFHLIRNSTERSLPAAVRTQRDELELAVLKLREQKGQMDEEEYYRTLEKLLLQLAQLYESNPVQK